MSNIEDGILQPKTFSFEWKPPRFFANCQKQGDYHKSPAFPIQYSGTITNWNLWVKPNRTDNQDYVSLYLELATKNDIEVTANYQLSIISQHNSLLEKKTDTDIFKGPYDNWGWANFVEQNVLKDPKSGALIDDTLIILCEVTLHPKSESLSDKDKWLSKIENLVSNYEELLESGSFTDVTFILQDKKIKLHKAILSCRSSVFKAMFEHEMQEKQQNSVEITDIDFDVMMELFRFIYSGKVQNIEQLARDLLIAADKYLVIGLKVLCEMTLFDKLTVDNAIEYLKLTDVCDTIQLKNLVIKFVADHPKEVVKKPEFAALHSNLMYQIMLAVVERD